MEPRLYLGKPDAPIVVAVAETIGLGKDLIRVKVNGGFITDGPVLTASTPSGTAINFANAVNTYEGGEIDFTAEVDGEYIYLFTEASYEQPFEIDFLDDDPSFEHNEYFDYVPLKRIGIRPHGGSFTEIPLHETVTLSVLHIYGSSRLGIKTPDLPITKRQVGYTYTSNYGNSLYLTILDSRDIQLTNPVAGPFFEHKKGLKQYELSNHLGNVLVVFEDKKISHEGGAGVVGSYTASLLRISDYYPGGLPMNGRTLNPNDYRYGHNTQESDAEITGNWGSHYSAEHWMYDSRVQRRWEIDPVVKPHESSYAAFANNYLWVVDIAGNDTGKVHLDYGGEGTSDAYFNFIRDPKQGDMYTVYGDLTMNQEGTYWAEHTTKVYHAGNDYAEAGWYSQADYELVNLDWANGQVMPPMTTWEKFPVYGDTRSWNGWGVDPDGYLTGRLPSGDFSVLFGGGPKAAATGIKTLAIAGKGAKTFAIYHGLKIMSNSELGLYIGKAKNGILNRYTSSEILKYQIRAFDMLQNIPNNGVALGVEQLIMELNGFKGKASNIAKPVLANINNATVKEIYRSAGYQWLEDNVPGWQVLFKLQ